MILCKCGLKMKRYPGQPNLDVDAAMGTYTRYLECECGRREKTVEMRIEDLSELRRMAHLYLIDKARMKA